MNSFAVLDLYEVKYIDVYNDDDNYKYIYIMLIYRILYGCMPVAVIYIHTLCSLWIHPP